MKRTDPQALPSAPPATSVRPDWQTIPRLVRAAVEQQLGSTVVAAESQSSGFSPGVAARLRLANEQRVFVKAIAPLPNPHSPAFHRREARIVAALPPSTPVPRLLHFYEEAATGWVVLLFEAIEGHQPAQPWQPAEFARVLAAHSALATLLTPSPLSAATAGTATEKFSSTLCGWQRLSNAQPALREPLDDWAKRHLARLAAVECGAPAAVRGDTLLHFDLRADNLLLTPERVWFVDWPHACVGAAWVDTILFAPSVTMQGGPEPEAILARHPAYPQVDPTAITAAIVSMAGFFTYQSLLPPPPGLPTLRAFQAAQGAVARTWAAQRLGWR